MKRLPMMVWLSLALSGGYDAPGNMRQDGGAFSVRLPPELSGPIDAAMPDYGRVREAHICAGDQGRVGVVWIRAIDHETLKWDDSAGLWRVLGSDKTLMPAPRYEYEPPGGIDLGPRYPDESVVYKPGGLVGMSVIGPRARVTTAFLPGIGPGSGFKGGLVGDLGFGSRRWHLFLNLWPSSVIDPSTHGITLARFSLAGWQKPVMVAPQQLWSGMWALVGAEHTDLFWNETYRGRLDLPEVLGGTERERLNHSRVIGEKVIRGNAVYHRPNHPRGVYETDHQIIKVGPDRFDLILRRNTTLHSGAPEPDKLMHVADLLRGRGAKAVRFGRCEPDSSIVALPLSAQRLQVVWLEEVDADEERRKPPIIRFVEAHLNGDSWSKPRVLFKRGAWHYGSLAAASFRFADQETILAIWRGENDCLTYTVRAGSGEWSEPATTDLVIGRRNWLVGHEGGFALVTKMKRNLFWCYFTLTSSPAGTPSR